MSVSHVDDANRPTMVDVGDKAITTRIAVARTSVHFPPNVAEELRASGYIARKGPIIDTAIIAGTMAVKRTSDLVPFCHPLAIERCKFRIEPDGDALSIECEVAVTGKTGVEMEALTGATIAALAIYDMTKALSHEIVIGETRLVSKRGGKRDVG